MGAIARSLLGLLVVAGLALAQTSDILDLVRHAAEALADTGEVPLEAAQSLRKHAGFDVERIHEIERETRHDVIAFTTAVAEKMAAAGDAASSRYLHYGLTSNDVVDTAQAIQMKPPAAWPLTNEQFSSHSGW